MSDVWLKIKAWTKGIVFALVAVYVILFAYNNSGDTIKFWWWFDHTREMSAFFLALTSFVAGALCAFLIGTTWRTMRQIRDAKAGRRLGRLERENADIRTKAGLLQPASAPAQGGVTVRVDRLGESE
jgi:uncharacterized integral membrane protein